MAKECKRKWKSLSCTQLFVNPWTVAHQAHQSMGFSRQEYWSGLPCPSLRDLPDPGIEPKSPALQMDSLPAEPQGKPKNTEVGSLSLLQGIFLTQGLNPGLPHCRQILPQLSYQGSLYLSFFPQILLVPATHLSRIVGCNHWQFFSL